MSASNSSTSSPSYSAEVAAYSTGSWNFVRDLGKGGYGMVFLLAAKSDPNRVVAVKKVTHDNEKQERIRAMVKDEIMIHKFVSAHRHRNVIELYEANQYSTSTFLYMEFAGCGSLRDIIDKRGGLPRNEAKYFFCQLAEGLKFLHSLGVAHRDIKPENLLIGSLDALKIADFGISTMFRSGGEERLLQSICGTRRYMAPEIGKYRYHAEPVDGWAAGVTLLVMLTGNYPWSRADETSIRYNYWKDNVTTCEEPWTKIEPRILDLLRGLLDSEPNRRPPMSAVVNHHWLHHRYTYDELYGHI